MGLSTPSAVALVGDGTAWAIERDDGRLVKVRLEDGFRLVEIEDDHMTPFTDLTSSVMPEDIALAGDSLLVLIMTGMDEPPMSIIVLDASTGEFRRSFGAFGSGPDQLRAARAMAVHDGLVYVADSCNHRIQVFNIADGTHVRSIGRSDPSYVYDGDPEDDLWMPDPDDPRAGTRPGEFNEPAASRSVMVAYVSEDAGRRLQVLLLTENRCCIRYPLQTLTPCRIIAMVHRASAWMATTFGSWARRRGVARIFRVHLFTAVGWFAWLV